MKTTTTARPRRRARGTALPRVGAATLRTGPPLQTLAMEHRKEARAGQAAEAGAAGLPLPVDPMDPPVEVLVGLVMEDVGVELLQQVDHTALLRVAVAVTVLEVTVTVEQPLLVVHTVLRGGNSAGGYSDSGATSA